MPRLATNPRAWLIEHRDGLRTTVLVLDGAVADFNFAVRASDGREFSAQLYRPPPPGEHHFSRLTEVIENFFRGLPPSWPVERNLLIAGLLETFGGSGVTRGERVETPELAIPYKAGGFTDLATSPFRIDHYQDLPKPKGDVQMFRPI